MVKIIKIFIGDIGSGKTLSLVRDVYKNHFLNGNTIYTNTPLQFSRNTEYNDNIRVMDKQFFKEFKKKSSILKNACVIVDEAHVFVDSRRSQSERNVIFSKFVTQSRKKSVDLYMTSQDKSPEHFIKSGQIELRVRKLVDRIIMCETYSKINGHWVKNYKDPIQKSNMWVFNYIFDKYSDPINKRIFKGNKYFSLYNTNEIIDILE